MLNSRIYTYEQLLAINAAGTVATLECTFSWYTIQEWRGVRLRDLLREAGASPGADAVSRQSVTGYTHVFPHQTVVPSRRGRFWVKWLRKVKVIGW